MQNKNVLIVEDEKDIAEIVSLSIQGLGLRTNVIEDGNLALDHIQDSDGKIDLFILDRMLPGQSGVEICRFLRKFKPTRNVPILMLTAMTKPEDIVEGLDAGADDYVTKPFDVNVLTARVKALLRRAVSTEASTESTTRPTHYQIKGIKIDVDQHKAWCDDQEIELTVSEFKLLLAFMQNPGKVLTRNQLVEFIQDGPIAVTDRTIDTHVFGLRKKLGQYSSVVETIRGIGYRVSAKE